MHPAYRIEFPLCVYAKMLNFVPLLLHPSLMLYLSHIFSLCLSAN
jgi:hypothetical protein